MKVFISSTIEDLKLYRSKAVEAVNRAGCTPTLLKYWGPSGHPPLRECLHQVAESDLLIVIVAHRYGWVPKVGHATPAGLYPNGATPEGIEDLAGNVWEWVGDWYGEYAKSGVKNPTGPESGNTRVLRGGAWYNFPGNLRAACRGDYDPFNRFDYIGFRGVREVFP